MQALILVYPSKKFFIQAIKENIVSPSHFSGLCKPLACIYTDWKKNNIYTHFLNNIYTHRYSQSFVFFRVRTFSLFGRINLFVAYFTSSLSKYILIYIVLI